MESADVPAMTTILPTSCEGAPLAITIALLVACLANVTLVCAWL